MEEINEKNYVEKIGSLVEYDSFKFFDSGKRCEYIANLFVVVIYCCRKWNGVRSQFQRPSFINMLYGKKYEYDMFLAEGEVEQNIFFEKSYAKVMDLLSVN